MQIPTDPLDAAALAAALAPGRRRQHRHRLEIDWNRDGTYGHALSDVTRAASARPGVQVRREFADSTPETRGVASGASGASGAQLTVTLDGSLLVSGRPVPATELFAPYNTASPLYGIPVDGVPIRWEVGTRTTRGWIWVRQFTGRVDRRRVSVGAAVRLVATDAITLFDVPEFWPMWAVDGGAAGRVGDTAPQRGLASSVVDLACNAVGLRTRPRPPWESASNVICLAWIPLCGSFAPAKGRVRSKDPWGVATGSLFVESFTTSPAPAPDDQYWVAGQWGMARNADSGRHPGTMHYTTSDDQPIFAGKSTSVSAWIYCGPTAPGYDANPSGTLRPPVASVYFGSNDVGGGVHHAHRLGIATDGKVLQIQVETGTTLIYRVNHTPGSNAWRHVHAQYDHNTGSPVRAKMFVDGTEQANFVPTGAGNSQTGTPISTTYPPVVGFSIQPGVRMSDAMAWQETGAPVVVPERTVTVGAAVDPSLNQITHLPTPSQAWLATLKQLTAAEAAVLAADEQGIVRWRNRDTARGTGETVFEIARSSAQDVATVESAAGVVNGIRVTARPGESTWTTVLDLRDVDEMVAPPGTSGYLFPLGDDVIAVETATSPAMYRSSGTAPPPIWSSKVIHGWVFVYDGGETEELSNTGLVSTVDQANLGDAQIIRILVFNNGESGRFRLKKDATAGTDPQPALRIAGLKLIRREPQTTDVVFTENVAVDGPSALEITAGSWHQDAESVVATARHLLRRTTQHIPTFDRITVAGDPRLQLADAGVLTLGAVAARVKVFVAGITRTFNGAGLHDELLLRATHAPGRWALGDEVLGRLESTATLG